MPTMAFIMNKYYLLVLCTDCVKSYQNLLSATIKLAHVPVEMKKGTIITLYKGGNKMRDDPDNCRVLLSLSC